MSYEDKILDKFADMIMPPGTIIAYQGIEAPEGFIVYDHIKIYEDEFPRLYPVLAANPNFKKGTDGDGRKWVELPEIEEEKAIEQKTAQVSLLKSKLRETDYVAIKIAEGVVDEEDSERYSDLIEQRKAWRKQINDLNSEISVLNNSEGV